MFPLNGIRVMILLETTGYREILMTQLYSPTLLEGLWSTVS